MTGRCGTAEAQNRTKVVQSTFVLYKVASPRAIWWMPGLFWESANIRVLDESGHIPILQGISWITSFQGQPSQSGNGRICQADSTASFTHQFLHILRRRW